jgi:hypothetical protein
VVEGLRRPSGLLKDAGAAANSRFRRGLRHRNLPVAARAGQRDVLSRALLWAVIEVGVPSERCSLQAASVAKDVVELAKLAGRGRALRRAGSRQRVAAFGPRTVARTVYSEHAVARRDEPRGHRRPSQLGAADVLRRKADLVPELAERQLTLDAQDVQISAHPRLRGRIRIDRLQRPARHHPRASGRRQTSGCSEVTSQRVCQRRRVGEAIAILNALLPDCQRILGADHRDTLITRHTLGYAYIDAGCTGDAIATLEALLADNERISGVEDLDRLTTRHNLGRAYLDDGRLDDAITTYETLRANRARTLARTPRHAQDPARPRARLPSRCTPHRSSGR